MVSCGGYVGYFRKDNFKTYSNVDSSLLSVTRVVRDLANHSSGESNMVNKWGFEILNFILDSWNDYEQRYI